MPAFSAMFMMPAAVGSGVMASAASMARATISFGNPRFSPCSWQNVFRIFIALMAVLRPCAAASGGSQKRLRAAVKSACSQGTSEP